MNSRFWIFYLYSFIFISEVKSLLNIKLYLLWQNIVLKIIIWWTQICISFNILIRRPIFPIEFIQIVIMGYDRYRLWLFECVTISFLILKCCNIGSSSQLLFGSSLQIDGHRSLPKMPLSPIKISFIKLVSLSDDPFIMDHVVSLIPIMVFNHPRTFNSKWWGYSSLRFVCWVWLSAWVKDVSEFHPRFPFIFRIKNCCYFDCFIILYRRLGLIFISIRSFFTGIPWPFDFLHSRVDPPVRLIIFFGNLTLRRMGLKHVIYVIIDHLNLVSF
jgi:hypothetical protein